MENIAYFYLPVEPSSASAAQTTRKPKQSAAPQPKQPELSPDRAPADSVDDDTRLTYPTLYL